MKVLLNALEKCLLVLSAPVLKYFNPPLEKEDEIREEVKRLMGNDIAVPEALIQLYQWHNGTQNPGEGHDVSKIFFTPDLAFCTFDDIEKEITADEFYGFRENKLFPLFQSFFGEFLALDLNVSDGPLIYCSTSDYEIPPKISKYDNMELLFSTTLRHYETKCLHLEETDGNVCLDFDKYDVYMTIGEKLNPNSDFWRVKREF